MKDNILKRIMLSRRFLLLFSHFLVFSFSQSLFAQETFLVRLQSAVAGQGTVQIHQDADIAARVMGLVKNTRPSTRVNSTRVTHNPDSIVSHVDSLSLYPGRKVRMSGFRVQVYAGANSRDAKNKAYQMEGMVHTLFPGQPVYTRFVSPRWICHVGDFRTREEALELLEEMRKTGKFSEAITVRCKINAVMYDE